jgi:hypothetical protein
LKRSDIDVVLSNLSHPADDYKIHRVGDEGWDHHCGCPPLLRRISRYLDYRKHRYYRSHSYDHYMLFSVDSVEKRNEPKAPPTEATEKPLSN